MNKIKDKCGLFAFMGLNKDTIQISEFLNRFQKLQHRGSDSFGITYLDKGKYYSYQQMGRIAEIFLKRDKNNEIENLLNKKVKFIMGHVRYATSGNHKNDTHFLAKEYLQPIYDRELKLAVAHNGNIPDKQLSKIIDKISNDYFPFHIDTHNIKNLHDTFILFEYLRQYQKVSKLIPDITFDKHIENVLKYFNGSFNFLVMKDENLFIIRDKYAFKPLSYGINEKGSVLISSENVNFDMKDYPKYEYKGNIKSNSVIKLCADGKQIDFHQLNPSHQSYDVPTSCVFEYIYFMNGRNSISVTEQVDHIRTKLGIELAKEETYNFAQTPSDYIVLGSPNTGVTGGLAYAKYLNLPYQQVLKKSKTSCRTFILSDDEKRKKIFKTFSLDEKAIKNKKIIFVDDSIVRGNTIKNICCLFKEKGAKEIHIRVLSPPVKYPCYYGINIPTKEELIINKHKVEDIIKITNLDSLRYLEIDTLNKVFGRHLCRACFDGKYKSEIAF